MLLNQQLAAQNARKDAETAPPAAKDPSAPHWRDSRGKTHSGTGQCCRGVQLRNDARHL